MFKTAELIKWSPSLSIGVENIDNEHKKLISLINKLNAAML